MTLKAVAVIAKLENKMGKIVKKNSYSKYKTSDILAVTKVLPSSMG